MKMEGRSLCLSKHELEIAAGAVHPGEISTSFEDIGGNTEAINRLLQMVQLIIKSDLSKNYKLSEKRIPSFFVRLFGLESLRNSESSSNIASNHPQLLKVDSRIENYLSNALPAGILLYGPPGCGKTMLARAVAREANVRFINVDISTLMNRWVGETEKYIQALFSLARKLAPVILFFDEIDCITRARSRDTNSDWAIGMKAQLLSCWDGIKCNDGIVVLGATNRPQDIDPAFMRRMPLQIKVDRPTIAERRHVLDLLLKNLPANVETEIVAESTVGFSGSELKELVRRSLMSIYMSDAEILRDSSPLTTEVMLSNISDISSERIACNLFEIS